MSAHPFPAALDRFGGDEELLQSMARMIADDAPENICKLEESLAAKESSSVASSAHALRGMLSTFEEGPAVDGLLEVENLSRSGDLAAAKVRFDSARGSIDLLVTIIRQVAVSTSVR